MHPKVRALWHGLRLVCPSCEAGRIYNGFKRLPTCDSCGVRYERVEEGEFLVTVVLVYSITAVMISGLVFVFNYLFPSLELSTQLALCLLIGLAFSLATYRNFKGLAIGLLHLTFGLKPAPTDSHPETRLKG